MTATTNKRCVKRGPKKFDKAGERANAALIREKMLVLLADNAMSVRELANALDYKMSTLRDYLSLMIDKKLIASTIIRGYGGASFAAVYHLVDEDGGAIESCGVFQKTLKVYPLNHVRDPLVAALFGSARA